MGCPGDKVILKMVGSLKLLIGNGQFLCIRLYLLPGRQHAPVFDGILGREQGNRTLGEYERTEEPDVIPDIERQKILLRNGEECKGQETEQCGQQGGAGSPDEANKYRDKAERNPDDM